MGGYQGLNNLLSVYLLPLCGGQKVPLAVSIAVYREWSETRNNFGVGFALEALIDCRYCLFRLETTSVTDFLIPLLAFPKER